MKIEIPFGEKGISVDLPEGVDVLKMEEPDRLPDVKASIANALKNPINTPSLLEIAKDKLQKAKEAGKDPTACIVVSDNTRPVPYAGEDGLLKPIISTLLEAGYYYHQICVLIACGTHRRMEGHEISKMIGEDIFKCGIRTLNHDCRDEESLVEIGVTERGTRVKINKNYANADLKILTGLVESHFMAGASGGRKSICPGIFGEEGTYVFHGPRLMAHPNSRDLVLTGNPVHEESYSVAKMAGVDFIANVTLNNKFEVVGVFCGDLLDAHRAAVMHLKSYVTIPIESRYDFVITHGGFVAINHYQSAKAAVASINAVKPGGTILQVANNNDVNAVGSDRYRLTLSLLKYLGVEKFEKLLFSDDWTFIPDQWQVQLWGRVFKHTDMSNYIYYAPQLDSKDWRDIPGINGTQYLSGKEKTDEEKIATVVKKALCEYLEKKGLTEDDIKNGKCKVAFLSEGPYGIPMVRQ